MEIESVDAMVSRLDKGLVECLAELLAKRLLGWKDDLSVDA